MEYLDPDCETTTVLWSLLTWSSTSTQTCRALAPKNSLAMSHGVV